MLQYTRKLFSHFLLITVLIAAAFVNWSWPLTGWLGDTPLYRFIWLGIFFVLLEIGFEVGQSATEQIKLAKDILRLSRDFKKLENGFKVIPKVTLPNNLKADYIIVGTSGLWLVTVKDSEGKVIFNGDDLAQDNFVFKGLLTNSLEKSFTLSKLLSDKFNREIKAAPVIVFSNKMALLDNLPGIIRGVYVSSSDKALSLIQNTDFQILDIRTIEEISKILKK